MPQARKNPRPRHHRHGQLEHSAVACRRESRARGRRARRLRRRVPRIARALRGRRDRRRHLPRAPPRAGADVLPCDGAPTSTEPLDEIAAFYGDTPWWVSDSHGLGPRARGARLHARLRLDEVHARRRAARGAQRPRRRAGRPGRARTTSPLSSPAGTACPTGRSRSPRTSSAGRAGRATSPTTASAPAGAGALYVHEGVGWLGFGATLPEFRGRGAQSAILAARIEDARRQGCREVTTETGELEDDRPVELVPKHRAGRFPGSGSAGKLPRGVKQAPPLLLVLATAGTACAATQSAHAPRRGSCACRCRSAAVVPELLDPGLQDLTDRADEAARASPTSGGSRSPGRRARRRWTRASSATCAPASTRRRAAGVDVYLDVYPNGSSQTPNSAADQADFADLDRVGRRRPAEPEARDRRQRVQPQPLLAAAVRQRRAGPRRDRLHEAARDDLRRGQGGGAGGRGASAARSPTPGTDKRSSARQTHSPAQFILDMGTAYRASKRTKPIMDAFAYHPYMERADLPPTLRHVRVEDADDRRLREARLGR